MRLWLLVVFILAMVNNCCMQKQKRAYGSWESDINSEDITSAARTLTQLEYDHTTGNLFWHEVRPEEEGRGVVCSAQLSDPSRIVDWTPPAFSVRSKNHEYGGGSYFVGQGRVGFTNSNDQRVYIQKEPMSVPVAVTPENPQTRFASGIFVQDLVYIIREDHGRGSKYPVNEIVSIDLKTNHIALIKLNFVIILCFSAGGADFYLYPRVDLSNSVIYWMQWFHPNMPWDGTEIWSAKIDVMGHVVHASAKKLLGDGHTNYQQPVISPTGQLHVISDQTNFWNVYRVDQNTDPVTLKNVHAIDADIGSPMWKFDAANYKFCTGDASLSVYRTDSETYLRNEKRSTIRKLATGITDYSYTSAIQYTNPETLLLLGASPTEINSVKIMNLKTNKITLVRRSKEIQLDPEAISVGVEIKFQTSNDQVAYAYYYPPKSIKYEPMEGELPPLLVKVHGGPTARAGNGLSLKKQYWTGKGFAILDVNYRGSTGYGRKYRDSLKDRDDCVYGARYLSEQGKADPKRLCISGGSAGGYLVLRAISVKDTFSAAVSHYGVSDLEVLFRDTHKFEAYYIGQLIGSSAVAVSRERSPIYHLDEIVCPVGFFQGAEDKVVPPNQAEAMYKAVKEKGFPTFMILFQGEGHGFRKAENIKLAIDGEYYYFCSVMGIKPVIEIPDSVLHIDNLP